MPDIGTRKLILKVGTTDYSASVSTAEIVAGEMDTDFVSFADALAVAAFTGTAYRVEIVKAWDGNDATAMARRELPALVGNVRPTVFGWFPGGPAAALATDLRARSAVGWPPKGVKVEEIKGDTSAACMGFADLVKAGEVLHPGDPLLDSQVDGVSALRTGDRWVFSRRGSGTCDAVYAVAGAVHLARSSKPRGRPRLIVAQ